MAGFLDTFFGNADQTQALGLLGANMMAGNPAQGFMQAQGLLAGAPKRAMEMQLLQAQISETQAQAQERAFNMKKLEAAALRDATKRQNLPNLYRQPGLMGGGPQPQMEGDVPMFSRPMGAAAVQATPGGFDPIRAMQDGWSLDEVQKLAGMQDLGRPKATRQMEVDDGQGGKRIALVDDFGKEVAGFAGYTAPVQVDTGKGTSFVKPMAGLNVAKVPTFGDDTARRGQDMSYSTAMRGQNMTDARAREFNATAAAANNIKREEKQQTADLTKNSQIASFDTMLGTLDRLKVHPGLSRSVGAMGVLPTMPGSNSANFQAELNTFQSQAFLPMVAQLKGMGALSDAEGKKLTAAVGALDPRMGERAFRDSVDRITADMESARLRMAGKPREGGATGGWGIKRVN